MQTCAVRGCPEPAKNGHKILSEELTSCDKHYDQVWLIFKNAHLDILAIIEELHWKIRNLDKPIKGGEEG